MDRYNHISSSADSIATITHILTKKRPTSSSSSSINSVRKPASKRWKKEVAPIKVYRVDSKNFKKVVQKLTGAVRPESEPSNCNSNNSSSNESNNKNNNNNNKRLRSMAPPPLDTVKPAGSRPPPSNINTSARDNDEGKMSGCSLSFWTKVFNNLSPLNNDIEISPPAPKETLTFLGNGGGSIVQTPSLGLCLSPSTYAWHYSFPFLSPGTMACLEEGTVP